MGLFSGKQQPKEEPVREDQVKRLKAALANEVDAMDLVEAPNEVFEAAMSKASARLEAVKRNSTAAEIREAYRRS